MQTEDEDASIVFQSAVFKLARNGRLAHRWHKRYAVLNSEGHLYLYSDEGMRSVPRVINLQQMCLRIKFGADTSDDYCSNWPKRVSPDRRFSLINMDRTYHFYTASEKEAASWKTGFLSIAEAKSIFTANWALSADPSESVVDQADLELPAKPKHPRESPLHTLFNTAQPAETVTVVEEGEEEDLEEGKGDRQVLEGEEEGESQENEPDTPPQHAMEDPMTLPSKDEPSPYDDFGPKQQSSLTDELATFEGGAASKKRKKTSLQRSVSSSEVKVDTVTMKSSALEELSPAPPRECGSSIEGKPLVSGTSSPSPLEMPISPPSPIANMTEGDESPLKEEEKPSHAPERRMSDYESQVHRLSQNLGRPSRKRSGKRLLWPPKSESQEEDRSPTSTQEEGEIGHNVSEASLVGSPNENRENPKQSPCFDKMVNVAEELEDQAMGHLEDKEAMMESREASGDKVTSPVKHLIRAVSPSSPLSSVPEGEPLAVSTPQDKQHTSTQGMICTEIYLQLLV